MAGLWKRAWCKNESRGPAQRQGGVEPGPQARHGAVLTGQGRAGGPEGQGLILAGKCPCTEPTACCLCLRLDRSHAVFCFSLLATVLLLLHPPGPCCLLKLLFLSCLQVSLPMRCLLPLLTRLELVSVAGLCVAVPRWA